MKLALGGGESAPLEAVNPTRFRVVPPKPTDKQAFVEFDLDGDEVKGLTVEQSGLNTKFELKK